VLVLAPHPDDFDAIGVTLKKFYESGSLVSLAVISGAESGVEDSFMNSIHDKTKAEVREAEQIQSVLFFGLSADDISFLHLEEDEFGDPVEDQGNLQLIKECIANKKPDIIFLPHGNDTNKGHTRTYSMCKKAIKELDLSLFLFLNRDPKTIEMRNDVYTVFGKKEANWKAELLCHHISQHQRNLNQRNHGFDERVLSVNREIAKELPGYYEYAEVFEIEEV
jgi:LmbE family N-acetylglucosaminyl deacetylase